MRLLIFTFYTCLCTSLPYFNYLAQILKVGGGFKYVSWYSSSSQQLAARVYQLVGGDSYASWLASRMITPSCLVGSSRICIAIVKLLTHLEEWEMNWYSLSCIHCHKMEYKDGSRGCPTGPDLARHSPPDSNTLIFENDPTAILSKIRECCASAADEEVH